MGQSVPVPHVMYRHIGGVGKRVAVPLRRVPERRRRLSYTIHHRTYTYRKTYVLPRNLTWTI